MYKYVLILSLIYSTSYSQLETVKLLEDWKGVWEGRYEIEDNSFYETVTIEPILDYTFYLITTEGVSEVTTRKYKSLLYLTLDDEEKIVGGGLIIWL